MKTKNKWIVYSVANDGWLKGIRRVAGRYLTEESANKRIAYFFTIYGNSVTYTLERIPDDLL